jgi:hypothetical protein
VFEMSIVTIRRRLEEGLAELERVIEHDLADLEIRAGRLHAVPMTAEEEEVEFAWRDVEYLRAARTHVLTTFTRRIKDIEDRQATLEEQESEKREIVKQVDPTDAIAAAAGHGRARHR